MSETIAAAERARQIYLWAGDPNSENPEYLSRQIITYIGNKRALLGPIGGAVERVKKRLGKTKLAALDAFSGSGVVSRFLKAHASLLISNDLEHYAALTARCYLRNKSEVDFAAVSRLVDELNAAVSDAPYPMGFIEEMYSPKDESRISKDDRVFYTKANARRLDNYRRLIADLPHGQDMKELLLGPLISEASIHANTAGIFKGFYKNRETGVGQFGGTGGDALTRILGEITLEPPVLSDFECDCEIYQEDANALVKSVKGVDLMYADPPYNQHPYGSNYFMLNLLARYERPERVSRVSGIPEGWRRSGYNVRAQSLPLLRRLLEDSDAPFLLISFNNEGFISADEMLFALNGLGTVDVIETQYNAFRGSRNFDNRPIHVTEKLFLVERK